jgi:hypothetical protein
MQPQGKTFAVRKVCRRTKLGFPHKGNSGDEKVNPVANTAMKSRSSLFSAAVFAAPFRGARFPGL